MKKTLFLVLFLLWPMTALGQTAAVDAAIPSQDASAALGGQEPDVSAQGGNVVDASAPQEAQSPYDKPNLKPRDIYNMAHQALGRGNFDEAAEGFIRARDKAAYDNELRFSAAYNLAFSYASKADSLGNPQELDADALNAVLTELQHSVSWFRDAVRQRPGNNDARENLEIVLKRSLAVKDILMQKFNRLEQQLDEVAGLQRDIREASRGLADRLAQEGAGQEPLAFQDDFRSLANKQRSALTQANWVAENAHDELTKIEAQAEEARSQEDSYRLFQLKQVQPLLELARQTMARARRQMRELSIEDSLRLSNQSFYLIQQAREQLQDPLAILRQRMADQGELMHLMTAHVMFEDDEALAAMAKENGGDIPKRPSWLNFELLSDTQNDGLVRTQRLAALFNATLEGYHKQKAEAGAQAGQNQDNAEDAERQIAQIQEALPLIDEAIAAMQKAISAIALGSVQNSLEPAGHALEQLSLAAERFADLKHLIELAYATQVQVSGLTAEIKTAENAVVDGDETPKTADTQAFKKIIISHLARNIDRLGRLETLLAMEAAKTVEKAAQEAQSQTGQPADAEAGKQKLQEIQQLFERAEELRQRAVTYVGRSHSMFELQDSGGEGLWQLGGGTGHPVQTQTGVEFWDAFAENTVIAEEALMELRILFFSIVEHVEELLRQQTQTLDSTTDVASTKADDLAPSLMPLIDRQRKHEFMADKLSEAITEQAKQMQAGVGAEGVDPKALQERSERFLKAADELKLAATAMRQVTADLQAEAPLFDPAIQGQGKSVEYITNALALLKDPQKQQSNEDQQQNQEQEKQEQQMSKEQAEKKIQQIRSREQERRKTRDARLPGMPVVDKDW